MKAIQVSKLKKTYRTRVKTDGLKASFYALIRPEWREIEAVKSIDLEVEKGEMVAFIGPNGAGKSTLIKMLCGIQYPTNGEIQVLGMSPTKERKKLAMQIGSVFGQKSQLWMHLPPMDSFMLLSAIYEVDNTERKKRIDELTELFELGDFLYTPVRKLSLGQRVRCEVAASLLHNPEILFLDEPTIGLDVVVKQTIRELIIRYNKERGTTVFLTSHDPTDIEKLCKRAIIIDDGEIILDAPAAELQNNYLGIRLIEVSFSIPQVIPKLPGVKVVSHENRLKFIITVDTNCYPVGELITQLVNGGNVLDITINNPPMEDIVATIFKRGGGCYENMQIH